MTVGEKLGFEIYEELRRKKEQCIGVWGSWKFGEEMLGDGVDRTGETETNWALGSAIGCNPWALF